MRVVRYEHVDGSAPCNAHVRASGVARNANLPKARNTKTVSRRVQRFGLRIGAPGRTRTSTMSPPTDFESAASTNSATGASAPGS
jgi:hypothetical protein